MTFMSAIEPAARPGTMPVPVLPAAAVAVASFVDPLDDDRADDEIVVTTRRAICRVALVASEAGGRFQREAVAHDPMTWMMAPRALFGGAAALDACLDRDDCLRGVLLHGLSLGLDADPAALDALTYDGDGDDDHASGCGGSDAGDDAAPASDPDDVLDHIRPAPPRSGERLFTATFVGNDGFELIHAFHASIASCEAEVAGRLYMRLGAKSGAAVIVDGFDEGHELVRALLAPTLREMLAKAARNPGSNEALGLDLNVEHRFFA